MCIPSGENAGQTLVQLGVGFRYRTRAVPSGRTKSMLDDRGPLFVLSQTTIPSGMVTFVISSKCLGGCSFDLVGVKAGRVLLAPESETWTVALPPDNYHFHRDVLPSMSGSFTVTP
jgi:hypothetical protein